ncbi:MAG: ATP-dependent RNA helicase HrpA [Gammaproteobacteria bacterium]
MYAHESTEPRIARCMLADRRRFRQQLRRRAGDKDGEALQVLTAQIEGSVARAAQRARDLPRPSFPESLPISAERGRILEAIEGHQVIIVCGETGSGKSTQLPKLCLAAGRGVYGLIGHTQPRRIAARAVAARVAQELGSELGLYVGYKVRFKDRVGPNSYVKVMTDGVLLAEIAADRRLEHYDTLIIDEAHERSLNIDLLLGYLKTLLPRRPELKLIITSATIDPMRFSQHFDAAPVIEVGGRSYPVELRYRPLLSDPQQPLKDLAQGVTEAVDELAALGHGDILVFLPGEREIRDCAEQLRKHHPAATEVLPLYARLSNAEQDRVFQAHAGRRIVLATNVAETSLTVPGVRYVIDSGLARVNRYSRHSKIQRLLSEPIAQASAEQRKGRCGREAAGVCIRLYSEEDYANRPAYADPELLRSNLAAVILQIESLSLGEVQRYPFIDAPDSRNIRSGYKLLEELGAVDSEHRLTPLGRRLARFPADPRIARMVLAAGDGRCLSEVLVIAAALSVQEPRERPGDEHSQADAAHRAYTDPRSDFLWFLNFWRHLHEQAQHRSKSKLRQWCREQYVSYLRVQEWQEVERQLRTLVRTLGFETAPMGAVYETIHRALLTGLLGHVGCKGERYDYQGARGIKFSIFPNSTLFKKGPGWLMAAELAETSRLYARTAAAIEPEWVEAAAAHLLRRSYSEPHWDPRTGRAVAYERVTLYGLTLIKQRKVDYMRIDPVESRRLLIAAIVEGAIETRAAYAEHNRQALAEVVELEQRARRLDIQADEALRHGFFDARIPAGICSAAEFERWRTGAEAVDPRLLFYPRELLVRTDLEAADKTRYPDHLRVADTRIPLQYRYEPGHPADGVTAFIPIAVLNQLPEAPFERLVPGYLQEKIAELLRTLPKSLRRELLPVEHTAEYVAAEVAESSEPLTRALSRALAGRVKTAISEQTFDAQRLPEYLHLRLAVLDERGVVLVESRDLGELQRRLGGLAQHSFRAQTQWALERTGITRWDFGSLPERVRSTGPGPALQGFPALADRGDSVAIRVSHSPDEAAAQGRAGLRRLFMLALPQQVKYLKKNTLAVERMLLYYRTLGSREQLVADLVETSFARVFLNTGPDPRDEAGFKHRLESGRAHLVTVYEALVAQAAAILERYHAIHTALQREAGRIPAGVAAEIDEQLQYLMPARFLSLTPEDWLKHLPRYLNALQRRIERLVQDPARDRLRAARTAPFWPPCKAMLDAGACSTSLLEFRWMLEELRVSVFAQELATLFPISEARLAKQWERVTGDPPRAHAQPTGSRL